MGWKRVEFVFPGGTDAARKLYGKRVRVCVPISDITTFDPGKPNAIGPKISLKVGQEGFVGHPPEKKLDEITLVFSQSSVPPQTIEQTIRSPFYAIHLNWPTFRHNFETDA